MSLIEKFMGIAFTLIALGIVVTQAANFNTVVTSIGASTSGIIGQLQKG